MAASAMKVLAGTLLVDDGTSKTPAAVPVYDANGDLPVTGTKTAGNAPAYDSNLNLSQGSLKLASGLLTATGTAAGSLSANTGLYFYNGTTTATYTLPAETNAANCRLHLINGTTNVLTIAPFGAETINAVTNTTTVPTNTAGSAALGGKTFYANPSTNVGFLAI